MYFEPTPISGVVVVRPERFEDERGFFARAWAKDAFEEQGMSTSIVQCSLSFNAQVGTLRGMHYQAAPHAEAKFVRCTRGAIFDVAVDVRPGSLPAGQSRVHVGRNEVWANQIVVMTVAEVSTTSGI